MSAEQTFTMDWTPIIQGAVTGIVTLVGMFYYVSKIKDDLCGKFSELKVSLEAHLKIADFYMKRFDDLEQGEKKSD